MADVAILFRGSRIGGYIDIWKGDKYITQIIMIGWKKHVESWAIEVNVLFLDIPKITILTKFLRKTFEY